MGGLYERRTLGLKPPDPPGPRVPEGPLFHRVSAARICCAFWGQRESRVMIGRKILTAGKPGPEVGHSLPIASLQCSAETCLGCSVSYKLKGYSYIQGLRYVA